MYLFFSETDESCKKHLGRVLSIWEERSVYENDVLEQLKQALYGDKKPRKRTYEQIQVDENENCSSLGSPSEPPQVAVLLCKRSYITSTSCTHEALLISVFYFYILTFIIVLSTRKKLYE